MSKRIMRTFKINEISAVDRPAQAGARMTILKRDSGMPPREVMKGIETMTEAEVQKMIADAVAAATTDISKKLTDATTQLDKLSKAAKPKPTADGSMSEPDSDEATCKAWRPYVESCVAKALAKAKEEFDAEVAKAAELAKTDETFTAADGTVIRKSEAGSENTFKILKAQEDRLQIADFTKKAETEIPHLPGEVTLKAEALRAVSRLDKKVGDALTVMLKAGSAALKANMSPIGHSIPNETSAEGQLDKMAKDYAAKNSVDYAKAYDAVLNTTEGGRLYGQAKTEKRAPAA